VDYQEQPKLLPCFGEKVDAVMDATDDPCHRLLLFNHLAMQCLQHYPDSEMQRPTEQDTQGDSDEVVAPDVHVGDQGLPS